MSSSEDRWKRLLAPATLLAATATFGCDDNRGLVPVSGAVLIDGGPVRAGSITVTPESGRPAYSAIDEQGRFALTTYDDGDGVVRGKHLVTVNAKQSIGDGKWEWLVPYQYSTGRSGLYLEVDGPTDEAEILLEWGGAKRIVEESYE